MALFGIIIGIIFFGMITDAAISKARKGRVVLSRGWYLILGLALALPSVGSPLALIQELKNPNPNVQTLSLPLTICFAIGCYLILRFFMTKKSKAEQNRGANALPRAAHD
jgi:phosphotransferase system  glucose/maltose/N-acetylglucosamine-specific IIC component